LYFSELGSARIVAEVHDAGRQLRRFRPLERPKSCWQCLGTASTPALGAQVNSEDRRRRQWGMADVLWGGRAVAASWFSLAGRMAAVFSSEAGDAAAGHRASSDAQTAPLTVRSLLKKVCAMVKSPIWLAIA
jgi:hypothetical protein